MFGLMVNGIGVVEDIIIEMVIGRPQEVVMFGLPVIGFKEEMAGIGKKDIGDNTGKR